MAEVKIIDASKIIGVYPISNTGAVLVYSIDYGEDRVLAGINDQTPEWCDLVEEYLERTGEQELGFHLGSFFRALLRSTEILWRFINEDSGIKKTAGIGFEACGI